MRFRLRREPSRLAVASLEAIVTGVAMAWLPSWFVSAARQAVPGLTTHLNLGLLAALGLAAAGLSFPSRVLEEPYSRLASLARSAIGLAYFLAIVWADRGFGVLGVELEDVRIVVSLGPYAAWILALGLAGILVGSAELALSIRRRPEG